jgi:hypothetical protein
MTSEHIYLLASRVNGEELIANFDQPTAPAQVVAFHTLEEAKELFSMAYKIMPAGPMENTQAFALEFQRLAIHRPVILQLPASTALQILTDAKLDTFILDFDGPQLLLQFHFTYFKVKRGFIDSYLALDILKDIESITSVDARGKIIINKFNVIEPDDNIQHIDLLTEEKAKEELRRRGLIL